MQRKKIIEITHNSQQPVSFLTSDALTHIANKLPSSDARRLVNCCGLFFFTSELNPVRHRASTVVREFLTHIMNSNLVGVKEILLADPGLLWEEKSIGKHERVTGLQLARNLGDVGMCQMMLECAEGKIEVEVSANTNLKKLFDEKYFDEIAASIVDCANQTVDAEIGRHLNPDYKMTPLSYCVDRFRNMCDEHGEMTPQDVINAFAAFRRNWDKLCLNSPNFAKILLFFMQVIGYIERLTPVWFRQALAEGIENLLKPGVVLQRVAECWIQDVRYPIVSLIPCSGLGFDFACDDIGGVNAPSGRAWSLKAFIEQQDNNLNNLTDAFSRLRS